MIKTGIFIILASLSIEARANSRASYDAASTWGMKSEEEFLEKASAIRAEFQMLDNDAAKFRQSIHQMALDTKAAVANLDAQEQKLKQVLAKLNTDTGNGSTAAVPPRSAPEPPPLASNTPRSVSENGPNPAPGSAQEPNLGNDENFRAPSAQSSFAKPNYPSQTSAKPPMGFPRITKTAVMKRGSGELPGYVSGQGKAKSDISLNKSGSTELGNGGREMPTELIETGVTARAKSDSTIELAGQNPRERKSTPQQIESSNSAPRKQDSPNFNEQAAASWASGQAMRVNGQRSISSAERNGSGSKPVLGKKMRLRLAKPANHAAYDSEREKLEAETGAERAVSDALASVREAENENSGSFSMAGSETDLAVQRLMKEGEGLLSSTATLGPNGPSLFERISAAYLRLKSRIK